MKNATWIWYEQTANADTYGEFVDFLEWNGEDTVTAKISVDSDYVLYINGQMVSCNQYGDFEWYKSYDSIDVTKYLKEGKNTIAVLVWYFGTHSQRYFQFNAGLAYRFVNQDGETLAQSGEHTLARQSKAYASGVKKQITYQLGYTFCYDANKEDTWTKGRVTKMGKAVVVEKNCQMVERPNERLLFKDNIPMASVETRDNGLQYVIDLGEEVVGCPVLQFKSDCKQTVKLAWGEDLQDGNVRQIIGERDFLFSYICKEGKNDYINYMLRLGCRYLQVYVEKPIEITYIGVKPQYYPTKRVPFTKGNDFQKRVYDLCAKTLELCMMEHYVDCPWREQCLYAFDSRNQMLCGYYAFEGGNFKYVRSNLKLMGTDRREDGMLSICAPCGIDLTIPSFACYYYLQMKEYIEYSGDTSLAIELFDKMQENLDTICKNFKDNVMYSFEKKGYWNFYDWTKYMESDVWGEGDTQKDCMLSLLVLMALECFQYICKKCKKKFPYKKIMKSLRKGIRKTFWNKEKGLYSLYQGGDEWTELVNSMAILRGLVKTKEAKAIAEKFVNEELTSTSLSMKCFVYDALLKLDENKYKSFVFDQIEKNYTKMMQADATSTWETIDGAVAFDNAGSLCHGWTAIPIYYYHKYLDN